MSGGDYLRGKLYGEGVIFRGAIFLEGSYPGAIIQEAIILGAIVLEPFRRYEPTSVWKIFFGSFCNFGVMTHFVAKKIFLLCIQSLF